MKKAFMAAALALVLLAVPAAWLQLKQGVQVGEHFYVQKNADLYCSKHNSVRIERRNNGADFVISVADTLLNAEMSQEDSRYTFRYEDGTVIEGYADEWADALSSADGAPLMWTDGASVYVGEESDDDEILQHKYSLSNDLFQMYKGICECRGHFLLLIMGFVMYALGVCSILWPETVHFWGTRWLYARAELSDDGIAMQKLSGFAYVVLGIVLLYFPFLR